MKNRFLGALAAALVLATAGFLWADVQVPSNPPAAPTTITYKPVAYVTGGTYQPANQNLLASVVTCSNQAGSRFVVEGQLATTGTLKLIATPTVAGVAVVASRTTIVLNGGTSLTGAVSFEGVSWIGLPNEIYQLQLGAAGVVNRLVVLESIGGPSVSSRRTTSGSSGGGGGAPSGPAGGDLAGTYPNPTISPAATPTLASLTVAGDLTLGTTIDTTGSGSPEGTIAAAVGSTYRRTDGVATSTLYVKEGGTNTTSGWTAFGSRMPPHHVWGFPVAYASATTFTIDAGEARDTYGDRGDITFTSAFVGLPLTVDIATSGQNGIDEYSCSATGSTTNTSTTTTLTSSYWGGNVLPSSVIHSMHGTATSSGTAVTGTNTRFKTELAVGDLLHAAAKGGARVTDIPSDTTCTIAVAFPGGDVTAGALERHENATIKFAAQAADRIKTVSEDGLTVTLTTAATATASGQAVKVGVKAAGCWLAVWVFQTTDGTRWAEASTQRTETFGQQSNSSRLIGCVYVNSSGNVVPFSTSGNGPTVTYTWECDSGGTFGLALRVVNGGTTDAAWHRIALTDAVPPGCGRVYLSTQLGANGTAFFRPSGVGDAAAARRNFVNSPAAGQMNNKPWVQLSGGAFDYATDAALYADVYGFDFQR